MGSANDPILRELRAGAASGIRWALRAATFTALYLAAVTAAVFTLPWWAWLAVLPACWALPPWLARRRQRRALGL